MIDRLKSIHDEIEKENRRAAILKIEIDSVHKGLRNAALANFEKKRQFIQEHSMNDGSQEVNDAVIILSTTCVFRGEHLWLRLRAPIGWTNLVTRLNGEYTKSKILGQLAYAKLIPSSLGPAAPQSIDASACSKRYGECFCPAQGYKWFEYYDLDGYELGLGSEHDGMSFRLELSITGVCNLFSIPFKYYHTQCLLSPVSGSLSTPPRRFSSVITTVCLSKEKSRAHDQFSDLSFFRDLVKQDGYRNVYMWRSLPFGIRVRTAFFSTVEAAKKCISSFAKVATPPEGADKSQSQNIVQCSTQVDHIAELSPSSKTALSHSTPMGAREAASKVAQFVSWASGWSNFSANVNAEGLHSEYPVVSKNISDLVKIIDASSVISFKSDASSTLTGEKRKNDDFDWEKHSDVSPKKQRSSAFTCFAKAKYDHRPALRPVDPSEAILSTSLNTESVLSLNPPSGVKKSRSDISRASPTNLCQNSILIKSVEPMSPLSLDDNKDIDSLDTMIGNFSLTTNDMEFDSPCNSSLLSKEDSGICPASIALDQPLPLGAEIFKTNFSPNCSPVCMADNCPWEDYFKVNMNPFAKIRSCECFNQDILEPSTTPPLFIDSDVVKVNEVATWVKTIAKYL